MLALLIPFLFTYYLVGSLKYKYANLSLLRKIVLYFVSVIVSPIVGILLAIIFPFLLTYYTMRSMFELAWMEPNAELSLDPKSPGWRTIDE